MGDDLLRLHATDRRGRHWSEDDDALLRRYAGKMDIGQIAGMLNRTRESVRKRADRLGIDYRCPKPTLMMCPRCGEWRTRLDGGICKVCHRRETRAILEQRERELLDQVDDAYREWAVSRRQGDVRRPKRKGLDPAELEELEYERLGRENATLRRRCERMTQWLRSQYVDSV